MGINAANGQIAGLTRNGTLLLTKGPYGVNYPLNESNVVLFDKSYPKAFVKSDGSHDGSQWNVQYDEDIFSRNDLVQYVNLFTGLECYDRAALKSDGTVVFSARTPSDSMTYTGLDLWEQYRTSIRHALAGWSNIVQIAVRNDVLLGLRSDGTMLSYYANTMRKEHDYDSTVITIRSEKLSEYPEKADKLLNKALKARNVLALVDKDQYFLTADEPQFTQLFGCPIDEYVRILKERVARGGLQK